MQYFTLKEAEKFLCGVIKQRTLLKYVSLNLVDHYRIGVRAENSQKDTRPIVFTDIQLNNLMQKFLIKCDQSEAETLKTIFPKPKKGVRNGH